MKKQTPPSYLAKGARFKTDKHGYVTVIDYYNHYTIIVEFENTGNIRATTSAKLRSGDVSDRSVPPDSMMVGKVVQSEKHGELTIDRFESDKLVLLRTAEGEEVRMLFPALQNLIDQQNNPSDTSEEEPKVTSLNDLTKRNKKTRDVNKLLKKMLRDYGK
ncbi:hypothetical protein [Vibrio hangzhouensis]|uniref:Uncharacterized protein n=1 Tax=Vibrio hangzhouensis TaxID=462991 RepID=A0A1H5RQE6_9VIBR|nr:hypothetical protein [Vibrio hangzhouensis]SEF40566.1 hypothetical protein SAMN04488244_10170 [Vibrio hangzhouensis]